MNVYEDLKFRVDLITDDYFPDEINSIFRILPFKRFMDGPRKPTYKNRIIKYIGLMYDPKSPFPVEYFDLEKRKLAVAEECNFVQNTQHGKNYNPPYQDFINLDSDEAKKMILAFLKHIHYEVWTEINTTEQELWEITQLRWEKIATKITKTSKSKRKGEEGEEGESTTYDTNISDKDIFEATNKKEKLMSASIKRREHLKNLYEEMYADNLDVKAAAREVPITPENALDFA